MVFDKRIAVVVRDDLEAWQKLNVTAFTIGGIAGTQDVIGEPYVDGSGVTYLPMIRQPIMVFAADREQIRTTFERARARELQMTVYTQDLFATPNDIENRAAVRAGPTERLELVGLALYGRKKPMDKTLKGLSLHS